MTFYWYLTLICAFVLFLVGASLVLQGLEQRYPAFHDFLDRHLGSGGLDW